MASVDTMRSYFLNMARGNVPVGQPYTKLNQRRGGIGHTRRGRLMYKVRSRQSGSGPVANPIAAQTKATARSKIRYTRKLKPFGPTGHSSSRHRKRKRAFRRSGKKIVRKKKARGVK